MVQNFKFICRKKQSPLPSKSQILVAVKTKVATA
nr:MAG TPA: hypothetical protein [Inoviridae sp.]